MSNKTTVYIPNEIKVREFDGKLLLSLFLVNGNYAVKIGSRSGINRELLYSRNGIYIPKSLTLAQIDFYKQLKDRGHKMVVMHSEGSILLKDIKEELLSMYPEECASYIDMYLVSGEEIKKMMIQYTPYIEESRIYVVGDPRFDLIKPKYAQYWEEEVKELTNNYENYILVNTNFATGNSKVGNDKLLKFILENPDYTEEFKKVRIKKQSFIHDIMQLFLQAIDVLSDEFPEYKFIIRPHPSESHEPYERAFKEKKNVLILHDGNVVKWILGAKAILHYDCTTGVEAILANKPSISYTPKINKSILAWLPVLASKNVTTTEELKAVFRKLEPLEKSVFEPEEEAVQTLRRYLYNYDSETSKAIVSVLDKVTFEKKKISISSKEKYTLLKKRFKSRVALFLFNKGLIKEKGTASLAKFGSITKSEVVKKLSKSARIQKVNGRFKIKILGSNIASIEK